MFSFHHHHHQMSNPYDMSQPSQKWKASVEIAPNCPRCDSPNTKFCYYNNYSLTQPRYFCKGCRRYWTKGGSLRNVPVGGGCRKNRRSRSSRIMSSSMTVRKSSSEPLIRPDQALNDMVGGSSQGLTVDDASTIDLAMLYNKFLNQRPASEPEPVWASSDPDPDPDQNNDNIELGEFSYLLDSGGFGELAIPTTVGTTDAFLESFFLNMQCPVAPQQQGGLGEDFVHGDWCGSLDVHSNFGAFLM